MIEQAKTSVLIADDHPIFRKGLVQILDEAPHLQVIAEASDGETAIQLLRAHKPSIAVLDIDMPKRDGLQVVESVRDEKLPTEIVLLTLYSEEAIFHRAMDLGVRGYLLKEDAPGDLIRCITMVCDGKYYMSPVISNLVIQRNERMISLTQRTPALSELTPSERRILVLIAENNSSREIAETLHISESTVETHRTNISRKLNLRGSHSLLRFALQNRSLL